MYRQHHGGDFTSSQQQEQTYSLSRTYLANVFSWMFAALAITAIVSYVFGNSYQLISLLITETGMSPLGWIVTFAPLGFVLLMSMGYQRFSATTLILLFLVFGILMGMSLSFIFLVYTMSSIYLTFAITAGTFGVMALIGYTTKTDLSKFGSILMMALVGIIIASIANFFMKSESLSYIISIAGVLIFTGLTAYDVQKLKRIGSSVESGTETAMKLTIMGALTLYLDFINLFLFLLRLFGNRR